MAIAESQGIREYQKFVDVGGQVAIAVANADGTAITGIGQPAVKMVTFTGAAGAGAIGTVSVFAVTGDVLIGLIVPVGVTDLTQAAPTATISLGLPGGSSANMIAATSATLILANNLWVTTAPQTRGIQIPAALQNIAVVNGSDVLLTIAAQNVTGGSLRVNCWWRPISSSGLLVAA